jgi:hypothetical protein
MRRRPTSFEFPALRFIQQRHETNRRRLQLRHLLLLLLRVAAIALLAFALARPTVKLGGTFGSQEAPVAAALIFDAAPRMEYRHDNQTRLEAARDLGTWLLAQLPEQSEIAVMDTRLGSTAAFEVDRGAAKDQIARLETVANSQPLPAAIAAAAKLLRQSNLGRKEVYVFTDLSRGAWPAEQASQLHQQWADLGDLGIYIIDVGIANPTDYGLGEVRLSGEVLSDRNALAVETQLSCLGAPATRVVELYLRDAKGQPQKRGERSCEATPGELRQIEFRVTGLGPGTHQGYVKIVGQDGLAADDTRYFTLAVKPAWRVLVAALQPAQRNALFLTEALASTESRERGEARFQCDVCDLAELANRPLADYAAVCLLDPSSLEPATWKKLSDYAAEGHGVAIFLGRHAQTASLNSSPAQELLPGKLLRQARRPDGDLHLAPRDLQHPVFVPFRSLAGATPWESSPVFRYWELEKPPAGTTTVLPYNDGRPAVLERPIVQGRVLTMTTPFSDRPSEDPWNLLPVGWPSVRLANQMMAYLTGSSDQQLNYYAGQTAILPLDAAAQRSDYMLLTPGKLSFPVPADPKRRDLAVTATDQVGNYRLQTGGSGGVDLGFSVNYAPQQTELDRLTDRELAGAFGSTKFQLAKTREQIDRNISMGRVGRELFPVLILIVAVVLGLEMLLANRFYRSEK